LKWDNRKKEPIFFDYLIICVKIKKIFIKNKNMSEVQNEIDE